MILVALQCRASAHDKAWHGKSVCGSVYPGLRMGFGDLYSLGAEYSGRIGRVTVSDSGG